jgi:hypothetical protein
MELEAQDAFQRDPTQPARGGLSLVQVTPRPHYEGILQSMLPQDIRK